MTALVPLACTGIAALVLRTPYKRMCSHCGAVATRLCDYRPGRGGVRCDALLCDACASSPIPGRDCCAAHAKITKFRSDMHALARQEVA